MKSLPTSHDVIINVFVHLPGHKIAATSPDITYKTRPHPAKVEGLLCFFFWARKPFPEVLEKIFRLLYWPKFFPFLFPNQSATGQMESSWMAEFLFMFICRRMDYPPNWVSIRKEKRGQWQLLSKQTKMYTILLFSLPNPQYPISLSVNILFTLQESTQIFLLGSLPWFFPHQINYSLYCASKELGMCYFRGLHYILMERAQALE